MRQTRLKKNTNETVQSDDVSYSVLSSFLILCRGFETTTVQWKLFATLLIYLFIYLLVVCLFLSHHVSDHHILILDNDKPSKNKDAVLNDDFI